MNEFIRLIKMEQRRIQKVIDLAGVPQKVQELGYLVIEKRQNRKFCYVRQRDSINHKLHKRYLGTIDSEAVKSHVKDRFLAEKLARLKKNLSLLEQLISEYQECDRDSVMAALPKTYHGVTNEDFVDPRYEELKAWAKAEYKHNPIPFPEAKIYSKAGLRMRSKGEAMLANTLDDLGIVYRYDPVLVFTDSTGQKRELCPDFYIQCYDGSFIIIEHLGRLFDKGYAINFGEKCYWYMHSGYVFQENFFVTSDDFRGGTDNRLLLEVAMHVAQRFYGC